MCSPYSRSGIRLVVSSRNAGATASIRRQQLCLVEQVLEVVHDEQQLTVLQRLGQMRLGGLRRRRRQAQGPRYRRGEQRGITDRGQIDEGHAVGEVTGRDRGPPAGPAWSSRFRRHR